MACVPQFVLAQMASLQLVMHALEERCVNHAMKDMLAINASKSQFARVPMESRKFGQTVPKTANIANPVTMVGWETVVMKSV